MSTSEKIPCASCKYGHYEEVVIRYQTTAADDVQIVIPDAKILRCVKCGDELIPPETQQRIDAAIVEETEQLLPRELEDIHDKFGLDQTEVSEVLGLGSKTFHRWLKGTQYPSRSMGYYLRVLAEFPEAFEWLKERGWRKRNRISQMQTIDVAVQFRDLDWLRHSCPQADPLAENFGGGAVRFNPASLFQTTKVK